MHLLSSVTIQNFKSIQNFTFLLTSYTPLVGYNNAGKSNVLEAIRWLLNKSSLNETYFCNPNEKIEISARIEGISEEILEQLPTNQKNSIEPYITDGKLDIKRVQETPSLSASKIKLKIKKINEANWVLNPNGLDNALKSLFPEPIEIGAMENAAEDVGKSKNTTTIGKLISEIMAPIEENHTTAITEALNGLKSKFDANGDDRAEELNNFDTEATTKLQEYFPGISIKLHVPTPEIKEVFKAGTLKVYENEIGRDLTSYGHGTQRSIQMTLIQHLADMKRESHDRPSNTLLLIDEPELYLHPQAIEQVRSGLKVLSQNGYQVIFTTHSPQMIPSGDIKHTLLIRKNTSGTHARERLTDAVQQVATTAPSQFELLFSLESSNQVLFSEKVLLAEGKTEKRLLPHLFNKFHNKTLGQQKIAFTELGGSANTYKSMQVLNTMDLPCKAVVDLDFAFKEASKNGLLDDGVNDSDFIRCKEKFTLNSTIELSEDGLPKKGASMTAAQAYEWLAQQPDVQEHINNLHQKLKVKNVWLWTKGAIEEHLNLPSKTEQAWSSFKYHLDNNDFSTVVTDQAVNDLLVWLDE